MEAKVLAEAEKAFFSCWHVLLPLFVNRQLIPNFLSGFFAVQRIAKLRPNRFQFEVRLASFRCSCKRTLTWCESRASRNCSGKNKNKGSAVDLTAEEQTLLSVYGAKKQILKNVSWGLSWQWTPQVTLFHQRTNNIAGLTSWLQWRCQQTGPEQ